MLMVGFIGGCSYQNWRVARSKNQHVVLMGSDITSHGGRKISINSEGEIYTQTCAEKCDDAEIIFKAKNEEFLVRILDQNMKCVLCEPVYADSVGKFRYTIAGKDKLSISGNITSVY